MMAAESNCHVFDSVGGDLPAVAEMARQHHVREITRPREHGTATYGHDWPTGA
jgi:hypothetical protein